MEFVKKDILTKPEEFAKVMYEALEDSFAEMSDEEFEAWLSNEMERPYVLLGTERIAIASIFKKAMCCYLGFLYYSKTLQR